MADALVSEASVARHEGSTPSLRINFFLSLQEIYTRDAHYAARVQH